MSTFLVRFMTIILCYTCLSEGSDINWKANTKEYGEPCVDSDECMDFRMVCSEEENICQCDQFHDWKELNPNLTECVPNIHRLRRFLSDKEEKEPGYKEELFDQAHSKFVYLGLAGIVAISLGVLLSIACVIFAIS